MLRILYSLLLPLVLLLTTGCQGIHRARLAEHLDPVTGITYLVQRETLVFARSQLQYSRSARDYLYLGPVEINRQGRREHFLWVGLGTTIDRDYLAAGAHGADTLYLELNGELMELPLRPWRELVVDLGHVEAYSPAVTIQQSLATPVTLDQLAVLAAADWRDVYLGSDGTASRRYIRWDEDPGSWSAFIERAADVDGAAWTARRGAD